LNFKGTVNVDVLDHENVFFGSSNMTISKVSHFDHPLKDPASEVLLHNR